jgi:type II secretory pathway component PulF
VSLQVFRYRARDPQGKLVTGKLEAESPTEAKRILTNRQLAVLNVGSSPLDRVHDLLASLEALLPGGGVSLEEMIVFNRQLQTSYSVGLSVLQALSLIAEQTQNETLRRVITPVTADLTEGHSLHAALARHPQVFDFIYVNTIKAGEASGRLDEILNMLSVSAEQRMENTAKVKNAIFYPKIVLVGIVVVIVVVVTFVIPRFESFYARFGGELPPLTLLVLAISKFFQNYWYAVLAAAGALYYSARRFVGTTRGRLFVDRLALRLPVFGPILLQHDLLTFATVLRLLLASGIPIVESLAIVRESLGNQVLKNEVEGFRREIEAGGSLSHAFRQSHFFPRMVGNLIAVGEEGGKVEDVLTKVASYYKVQLDFRLNNLSKAIEPAFLVLIFGMVLVLVLSIFLPIWKMSQLLRPH